MSGALLKVATLSTTATAVCRLVSIGRRNATLD